MRAMIFAAGLGSRMGEISETVPKCLLEVGGKTLLEHVVERLKNVGVDDVVINLHHHADQIRQYLAAKGNFGIKVNFSFEATLLNTGGGLKAAHSFFADQESFLVHNGDVYSEIDLSQLLASHRQNRAVATLAVQTRQTDRQLLFDQELNLIGWSSASKGELDLVKPAAQPLYYGFAGIQALSGQIFKTLNQQSGAFSIISSYLLAIRNNQKVVAFPADGAFWMDVGTPEKLSDLRDKLAGRSS